MVLIADDTAVPYTMCYPLLQYNTGLLTLTKQDCWDVFNIAEFLACVDVVLVLGP